MSTNKRSTYEEEIAALMNVRLEDTQFYKDVLSSVIILKRGRFFQGKSQFNPF
jgi:hypothetical protein